MNKVIITWGIWMAFNAVAAIIFAVFYLWPGLFHLQGRVYETALKIGYPIVVGGFVAAWIVSSIVFFAIYPRLTKIFRINLRFKDWPAWAICLLGILIFTALAYKRHTDLRSGLYDFGLEHQVIYNTSQGRLFQASVEVDNYLGDHFSPLMAIVSIIYAVFPAELTLFILQSTAVMIAALGIYYLAKNILQRRLYAYAFLLMFLAYWGIYGPLMFDFHPISFAFPFLVWGIYLLQAHKKLGWASFMFVIATLAKEDVGIFVGSIGIYWAIKHRDWRAWLLAAYGFIFSLVGLFVLIPFFRGNDSDTLTRYAIWGSSGTEIVKNILSNPVRTLQILSDELRITYLIRLFFPLGFLSLLAPGLLLVVLPSILINLFSSFEPQLSLLHQYDVMATVGVFWAAMIGCKTLGQWWNKRMATIPNPKWLFACLLILINIGLLVGHPIVPNLLAYPERQELYNIVQKLKTEIPKDDFVMTSNFVGAHFGTWQKLKILDHEVSKLESWPDWIVIDLLEKNFWNERHKELTFILGQRDYTLHIDNPLLKVYRLSK